MRIIAFITAIMSVFTIVPAHTYITTCPGTLLEDENDNLWEVRDELKRGNYLMLMDTHGTETPEDDEVLWIFDCN